MKRVLTLQRIGTTQHRRARASHRAETEYQGGSQYRANDVSPSQQPRSVSGFSEAFVGAFERSAAAWGDNARLLQDETMRFLAERLEHAAEMVQRGEPRLYRRVDAVEETKVRSATSEERRVRRAIANANTDLVPGLGALTSP